MTIEEGTGDEFLLTCFVCKNPFGLVAQFCGYCQATRQQALGVERARPNQQIINVATEQPTAQPTQQPTQQSTQQFVPPITRPNQPTFQPSAPHSVTVKPVKAIKQKSVFLENAAIRSKSVNTWQKKNSKLVTTLGLFSFIFSSYFSAQSLIFASTSPEDTAQKHLQLGVTRDAEYFEGFPDNSGIRFFPFRFSPWDDSSAGNWVTNSSWNGWKGSATVNFQAGGSGYSGIPVTAKYDADYESFLGIFRKIQWVSQPPATINIQYPGDPQLSIYINGLAAGTVSRPSVSEGQYQMYPGEFDVQFFDLLTGEEETTLRRTYFIDAYGDYVLNFD
jgi:hypothetical protein